MQAGILDAVVEGRTPEIIAAAEQIADRISPNAATGVWGLIKVRSLKVERQTRDIESGRSCFHNSTIFTAILWR